MNLTRLRALLSLSTVRQTLWLLSLFAVISACAWGGTYWLVKREMLGSVDARLASRMQAAETALEAGDGLPAAGPGETVGFARRPWRDGFQTVDTRATQNLEFRFLVKTTAHGRIVLGENTERQEELRDILAGGMQVTLLGTLFATFLVGLWMARRGQRRMGTISAGLAQVAQGRLDTRIVLDGKRDDLSVLADRINTTTERLDQAMTQMRVQSSNIAHDLRTPLARLRAQLEASLMALTERGRPVEPEDIGRALEQIDHITGTFDALLRLARIESGAGRAAFASVDLGRLVEHVAETFGPVVEDTGQTLKLDIDGAAQIAGDHDLLVQLAANLLQNAMRYGPTGQTITMRAHGCGFSVTDQGPGIPPSERGQVLEPLFQSETTRQDAGFGLGLSIVRAISELHDAELSLSDGPDGRGLEVQVRFPQLK